MRVDDLLDELRTTAPGCRLAAFIDLDARLVLAASAPEKPRQEALDNLAETAARILLLNPDPPEDSGLDQAVFWTVDDTFAFVRAMAEPAEVVCCKCQSGTDIKGVLASARVALDWIGKAAAS